MPIIIKVEIAGAAGFIGIHIVPDLACIAPDSDSSKSGFGYERTSSAGLLNVRFWSDSDIGDDERKGWGNNVWCLPGHHDRRAAVLATQDFLHSQLDPGRVPVGGLHHVYRFAA